jgi:oligopeptidase A
MHNDINYLLSCNELPVFSKIHAHNLTTAIDKALLMAQNSLNTIQNNLNPTWQNTVQELDEKCAPLSYAWAIANHISAVKDTPEWRTSIDENIERVTTFWSDLMQNEKLYAHYKTILSNDIDSLSSTQIKILNDSILGFKLGGADLEGEDKQKFADIQVRQAILTKKISDNVLDANDGFKYYIKAHDKHLLAGVPEYILVNFIDDTHDNDYKITLQAPCYGPIMQYCHNRDLRELLYKAANTRASDILEYSQGKIEWDNAPLIKELLSLRQQEANLLGYENYAQVSLATKMAKYPQKVLDFSAKLLSKAKPFAQKEYIELQNFAKTIDSINKDNNSSLELWDISYLSELLQQQNYGFSEQEVQQYFTLPTVLKGLFNIIEQLFAVNIIQDICDVWHEDVGFYTIKKNDQIIANFYLDLYSREGKQSGAWMDGARTKSILLNGNHNLPAAYLICNFPKSLDANKPSCLTHDDVITLFHEFGHGLHHMLTKITDSGASGISGVEWDAVELPSQFMENFCWEYDVIQSLTCHVEKNSVLPKELFDKMINAKNFLVGLFLMRQLTLSLCDMQAHIATNIDDITRFSHSIHKQYHILPILDISRWANTFTHVFAGGYAAGYYSYHWAEVLSSDVFGAFEEAQKNSNSSSLINANIGLRYLQNILEVGGSRPAMDSFIAFMGREPTIDAFLRHNGLS